MATLMRRCAGRCSRRAWASSRPKQPRRRARCRLVATSSSSSAAAAAAPPADAAEVGELSFRSPKVEDLYSRIATLPEEDVNVLGALVVQVLGLRIFPGQFGGAPGTAGGGPEAGAVPGEEDGAEEERTHFDLKLLGFDAKSKIKVIKEVRSIAGLGLKEAKELVESAPKVVQRDLKSEKAEELKSALEAVGAQVELV